MLHRRVFLVQTEMNGAMSVRQPTLFLDIAPAASSAAPPDDGGLPDLGRAEHALVENALQPFLVEIAVQREREIATIAKHVEISLSGPEKTTVHGNISTLHIWWARRPHAACRAVLCASLWLDPADPACPNGFVKAATKCLREFAAEAVTNKRLASTCSHDTWRKWQIFSQANNAAMERESHGNTLRYLLLDFIADFSKWENQAEPTYLRTAREITRAAQKAVRGDDASRPLVFDPFAGGGTIPLEAIRLGVDAFASDLNPVAVLLNKVVLEFSQRCSTLGLTAKARATSATEASVCSRCRAASLNSRVNCRRDKPMTHPSMRRDFPPVR